MASNSDVFMMYNRPNDMFQAPERPNHKIHSKVLLQQDLVNVFRDLRIAFDKDGLEVRADQDNNVLIVTGIPPENGYDAKSVLKLVKKHDNNAEILSHTEERA